MRFINTDSTKLRNFLMILAALSAVFFSGAARVLAHNGEDHGEEKPKIAATTGGTITRSTRLGDFEMMLKHSPLEPDAASAGRLFITKFYTNEPVGDANPAIEIESANGAVTEIPIEKTDAVGSYTVKIPALTEGAYTIRIKTVVAGGKNNTATFSGVEIAHREAETDASNDSWTQTALISLVFLVIIGLFGSLVYFARRAFKNDGLEEETVSV